MSSVGAPVLVMGVSGSGKSTVGAALAEHWGDDAEFVDADSLHPEANKDKMAAGIPLTDEDRWPWLDLCARRIHEVQATGKRCVMANSALKRVYRDRLRSVDEDLFIVSLSGPHELIADRQRHRQHEYMPNSLLDSQFATLEPLQSDEPGVVVHIDGPVDETVRDIEAALLVHADR
ncbi:gluconokinase [Curtobacterium sp. RRHDQ10]|uniref:gluconokinase n=1 Tax=Curtobacterium phyllosphaerae TaxID=3413379 RepID=UPI003BF092BC